MTTVSPKKGHDQDKVNEISAQLMDNPALASLIGELSTSTDDASELVKDLLQASDQCWSAGEVGCAFRL